MGRLINHKLVNEFRLEEPAGEDRSGLDEKSSRRV